MVIGSYNCTLTHYKFKLHTQIKDRNKIQTNDYNKNTLLNILMATLKEKI